MYTPQTWTDGSAGGTPISAARLTVIEDGIESASRRDETMTTEAGATYTPVLGDAGRTLLMTSTACTITLPSDGAVAFPVGTIINFIQMGSGSHNFEAGVSATVYAPNTNESYSDGQYCTVTALKTASNTWVLQGKTAAS